MLDIRMKDENTSWQEWYEKNPRLRKYIASGLTHGKGINDLPYVTKILGQGTRQWVYKCKYHSVWESMLKRAYQSIWLDAHPTYLGVVVCSDWKVASNFTEWMKAKLTVEGTEVLHLDKDILYPGNKEYSPNTCVFVPQFLNMSLNICERGSGSMPKGVRSSTLKDGDTRYSWQVKAASGKLGKGGLTCKWEAHKEWQLARASVIEAAIEKYKLMDCYREDVVYAVKSRADKLRYDAKFGLETTRLP